MAVCGCGRRGAVCGGRCVLCLKAGRRHGPAAPERSYDPETMRGVLAGEMREWGEGPLFKRKPRYVDAIARDAGIDVDLLDQLHARLQQLDQCGKAGGSAANRIHHALLRLVVRLMEQVASASVPQLDGYVRARSVGSGMS